MRRVALGDGLLMRRVAFVQQTDESMLFRRGLLELGSQLIRLLLSFLLFQHQV